MFSTQLGKSPFSVNLESTTGFWKEDLRMKEISRAARMRAPLENLRPVCSGIAHSMAAKRARKERHAHMKPWDIPTHVLLDGMEKMRE